MKKNIFLSLTVCMLAFSSYSQTYITQVKSLQNKKWGYISLNGDVVVEPKFEKCYQFSSDGLAAIYDSDNRQYYFINTKGERLATDVKDFKLIDRFGFGLEGFNDGMIPVKIKEKWGYMNSEGKVSISAKYDEVKGFGSGHAAVVSNGKFLIVNTSGEEIAIESPGVLEVKEFSENLAPFRASDKKFGYLDVNGKVSIKPQFESAGYFKNGIAWAKVDGKVGYIDPSGEWIIKPQFTSGGNFDAESGLARVKTGSEWGYVNKEGKVLRIKDSTVWEDFSEGLALGKKGGLFGFYNNEGTWAINSQFEGARDFKNGYAAAKKGDKWGMIDKSGKWVIEPAYDGIRDMELIK